MIALAAAQLGYRTHVLAPDRESVAAQTASSLTRADYHNRIVLADFAAACAKAEINFHILGDITLGRSGPDGRAPPVRPNDYAQAAWTVSRLMSRGT